MERLRLADGGDVPEGSDSELLDLLPDEGGLGNPLPLSTWTQREKTKNLELMMDPLGPRSEGVSLLRICGGT